MQNITNLSSYICSNSIFKKILSHYINIFKSPNATNETKTSINILKTKHFVLIQNVKECSPLEVIFSEQKIIRNSTAIRLLILQDVSSQSQKDIRAWRSQSWCVQNNVWTPYIHSQRHIPHKDIHGNPFLSINIIERELFLALPFPHPFSACCPWKKVEGTFLTNSLNMCFGKTTHSFLFFCD